MVPRRVLSSNALSKEDKSRDARLQIVHFKSSPDNFKNTMNGHSPSFILKPTITFSHHEGMVEAGQWGAYTWTIL